MSQTSCLFLNLPGTSCVGKYKRVQSPYLSPPCSEPRKTYRRGSDGSRVPSRTSAQFPYYDFPTYLRCWRGADSLSVGFAGTCILTLPTLGVSTKPGGEKSQQKRAKRHWDGVGCAAVLWSPHPLLHVLLRKCKVWQGMRGL